MKNTRKSLILSTLSFALCIAMLIGTTYAWFTDSVTSGKNKIIAGNLDVELVHSSSEATDETVQGNTDLFPVELWEPGVISYENFTVKNVGTLALKYKLNLNVADSNSFNGHDLTEVIKVAVVEDGFTGDRATAQALTYTSLKSFQVESEGWIKAGESSDEFGVVLYWEPTDNDNNYNLNNGRVADDGTATLYIDFGVELKATQKDFEEDSFDNTYDVTAADFLKTSVAPKNIPLVIPVNGEDGTTDVEKRTVRAPEDGETLTRVIENQDLEVTYGVGTVLTDDTTVDNATKSADAKIGFEYKDDSNTCNIEVKVGQEIARYDMTLNIEQTNTVLNKIVKTIPKGLVNVVAYHASNVAMTKLSAEDATPAEESYFYNPKTGKLTLYVYHASDVIVRYDTEAEVEYYNTDNELVEQTTLAAFRNEVNGGRTFAGWTVKLCKNVALNEIDANGEFKTNNTWVSIGYGNEGGYAAVHAFEGIFDGNGKTISGVYHHCYDNNDIDAGRGGDDAGPFGLFGCVKNATIKNLTVDHVYLGTELGNAWYGANGAGGFVGVAIGNCNFTNLTLKNATISGYLNCIGGIVGGVSQGNFVFDGMNVDVSNELTTWSWGNDSACDTQMGGIVGTVDQQIGTGRTTSHVTIKNSTVAAKIMQMNDVLSNYAWYQYRGSGMLVGAFTFNHSDYIWNNADDISEEELAAAVTCENVTVTYDMWNHQYYCTAGEHIAGKTYSGDHLGRRDGDEHWENCNGDDCLVFDQLVGGWTGGTWRYEPCVVYKTLDGVTVNYLNGSKPVDD